MRSLESKTVAEEVLRFSSILVEPDVLCDSDVKKAVTQNLAFNKKQLNSWGPNGSVFCMFDLRILWLGVDGWIKTLELRKILDCLLCSVIGSPNQLRG